MKVNNSKFVCTSCRRLFSSSCKNSKDGICALCLSSRKSSPVAAATAASSLRKRHQYNIDGDESTTTADESTSSNGASMVAASSLRKRHPYEDGDESTTTADESTSSNGASMVAVVERKVRRQIEGLTSQFLSALQEQNRKLEANSRLLESYIKSQKVLCYYY
jgi:hypothetical protein